MEGYFLLNFCMNMLLLVAVARARGRVSMGAIGVSAGFGALYAVAMQTETFAQLRIWPLRLLLVIMMVAGALRPTSLLDYISAICLCLAGTATIGGAQMFLMNLKGRSGQLWALSAGVGGVLLLMMLCQRRRRVERFEARLVIAHGGRTIRLLALVDTGNRLREPLSGLPVLIVDARRLKRLLPEGFDPHYPARTLGGGFRLAPYSTLGGAGEMAVFRPDSLLIGQGSGYLRAPDVWVGICPDGLPADVQALAPPILGLVNGKKNMRVKESG